MKSRVEQRPTRVTLAIVDECCVSRVERRTSSLRVASRVTRLTVGPKFFRSASQPVLGLYITRSAYKIAPKKFQNRYKNLLLIAIENLSFFVKLNADAG